MRQKFVKKEIARLGLVLFVALADYPSFGQIASDSTVHETVAQASGSVPKEPVTQVTPTFSASPSAERHQLALLQRTIPLRYNPLVKKTIKSLTNQRTHIQKMLNRRHLYFPLFEEALIRHGLPTELKYLAVVESHLNPRALSRAKAAGLWQFMPSVGKSFGLEQDAFVDERMDPDKATEAACRYLKSLYNMFGDWELALASYNAGPGRVRRAIRRAGNRTSFQAISPYLPKETRAYVPTFVAVNYVMHYYPAYQIEHDSVAVSKAYAYDTIQVDQPVDLARLATQLNLSVDDLKLLNPSFKGTLVPALMQRYTLRIPEAAMPLLFEQREAVLAAARPRLTWQQTRGLLARNTIYANPDGTYLARENHRKISHRVRKGEEIGEIAVRYAVTTSHIRQWNRLKHTHLKPGQQLQVWIPVTPKQTDAQEAMRATYSVEMIQPKGWESKPLKPIHLNSLSNDSILSSIR